MDICFVLICVLKTQEPEFVKGIEDSVERNYFNWRTKNMDLKNKVWRLC